jgi:hypothetical protein
LLVGYCDLTRTIANWARFQLDSSSSVRVQSGSANKISTELEFQKGKFKGLLLNKLGVVTKKTRRPPSRAALEKKVVSHAMRRIAFLIKTDDQIDFKSAMRPETMKAFEKLWVSLAGKVF